MPFFGKISKLATLVDGFRRKYLVSHLELNLLEGDMVSVSETCLFSAREGGLSIFRNRQVGALDLTRDSLFIPVLVHFSDLFRLFWRGQ